MKKILIVVSFVLCGIGFINGAIQSVIDIPLQVETTGVYPSTGHGDRPRTPIARPSVAQDGHTLYFNNVGYDLTLVLLDEDGEEAYTTFVAAGTTAVVLPSTLSGEYEFQLLPGGSYYFYSDITL